MPTPCPPRSVFPFSPMHDVKPTLLNKIVLTRMKNERGRRKRKKFGRDGKIAEGTTTRRVNESQSGG